LTRQVLIGQRFLKLTRGDNTLCDQQLPNACHGAQSLIN
jgi:hypothetical protein